MRPPWLARLVLSWLAPREIRDALLDDLDEAFRVEAARRRPRAARLWYWRQAATGAPPLMKMQIRRATRRRRQERSSVTVLDTLARDLRYSLRLLARTPAFTAAAVITLGLGIGANAAVFSVTRAVLLQPLPYGAPDRLVMVWKGEDRSSVTHLSLAEIASYAAEAESLMDVGGYVETNVNLTGGDDPERVRAGSVTANLFDILQVQPFRGRTFVAADGRPGADRVVIVAHGLWMRRFGAEPDIVGRTIPVNEDLHTVIGIMPPPFRLPLDYRAERPTEVWVPQQVDPARPGAWGDRSYLGVGRLRPGAVPSSATSELAVIADRWVRAGYVADEGDGGLLRSAVPMDDFVTGPVRPTLLMLAGAVGCVLLIACANVMNLLLARADVRRREVAVRTAVGASRWQIGRQIAVECAVLSAVGAGLGIALALAGLRIVVAAHPSSLPRLEHAAIDGPVLAFTAVVAVLTALVSGLLPAFRLSRSDLGRVLNEGGRGETPDRARRAVRRALITVQLAGSVVLVIAAGLLVRSLIELYRVDLGFNPTNVLTAQIQLPRSRYPDAAAVVAFYREVTQRVEGVPGVSAAGAVRVLPLARHIGDWSITIQGRPYVREENPNGDFQWVTPGYFETMGIQLLRGRRLTVRDRENAPLVAVINDTMAERYWPGGSALGGRFHMGGPDSTNPRLTIVGIVGTARHNAVTEAPRAEMYLPHAQLPESIGGAARAMALVARTTRNPEAVAGDIREIVRAMDRSLPLSETRTMEQITATALGTPRFASLWLGLFAALALVLAAVGTYGTISLLVSERSREIGIRMALGAGRASIAVMILGEGLVLGAVGAGLGVAGAMAVTRLLATLVYGVDTLDPVTFTSVPLVVVFVALLACVPPARRAASVDPVVTLRAN